MDRYWDKNGHYSHGVLKEYKHWILELSYRQHTLGSYILFAKREIENFHEMTAEESEELKYAMKEMETTLGRAGGFRPDKFNYWQMGNGLSRLHFHGIPRYKDDREYAGIVWKDESWGSVPNWNYLGVDSSLIERMRAELLEVFNRPI